MKKVRVPRVFLVVALAPVLILLVEWRDELVRVPRIRVGPLVEERPHADGVLRLFALGDTGTGDDAQRAVAAAMERRCREAGGAHGIVLLGDNSYQTGFSSPDDPEWQTKVWGPYGDGCLASLPIFPVLGNHDYKGNPAAQIEHTLVNPRWRMPNRFYAVRFGSLLELVAYDSQVSDVCFKPAHCSVDFLLHRARTSPATWKVAAGHHPLESASAARGGHRGGLRGWLLAPLLCDRLDVYLGAHAHHLEHRTHLGCRLESFVSGGGGGPLQPVRVEAARGFVAARHGFLELEASETELTARFFDESGEMLHETRRAPAPAS